MWLNIYCNRLIFDDFVLWIVGQTNITNFLLYLIFFPLELDGESQFIHGLLKRSLRLQGIGFWILYV